MLEIIDKREEITAIEQRFGHKHHLSLECIQAKAELWGAECNDCGVVIDFQRETLFAKDYYQAQIKTVETRKAYWLIGIDASTSIAGYGYAPSVCHGIGFSDYYNARSHAIDELLVFFTNEMSSTNSCYGKDHPLKAQQVINALKTARTPQLDLF